MVKNGLIIGCFLLVFMMLCPVLLSAQTDLTFSFAAILQKGQNASAIHMFSEQNPVTYMVFTVKKVGMHTL